MLNEEILYFVMNIINTFTYVTVCAVGPINECFTFAGTQVALEKEVSMNYRGYNCTNVSWLLLSNFTLNVL